ncbi:hypothetical protein RhiirA4_455013 [Rhizophagus irregularis]|uniref:Uncharacterized protein n=1 Tax=Rhizophagus irregularis TaxID=588596 RepID=A0A2I1G4C1_9GLOM|nr:hypothetical protein RhiirA4_455013 [Rhizophagus irregularis]
MAFNSNNRPQVDYLLVKQLITKLGNSSFLKTIRVGLREYNADNLGEREIVDTVEHIVGEDLTLYENFLSEHIDVLSTFGVKNVNKLYHFLYIALMCSQHSQHFQLLLGQEVDNLYDSLQIVAQIESEVDQQMEAEPSVPVSPNTLKADAVPFTPKGKERNKRVSYADAVKQDSNSDTSRPSSPSPTAPKKQPATPAPKTISTVMTGYNPEFKENVREITVYDIPSRWTQLDVLNLLKNWGQVIAIKFKSQQKYTTVTVSVDLNKAALDLWNGGAWTAPLGGIPVR